jgi:hypothetical protein
MNIKTEYRPDLPGLAWIAYDDDTYDGPGSPIGSGKTEQDAIDDLFEELGEVIHYVEW